MTDEPREAPEPVRQGDPERPEALPRRDFITWLSRAFLALWGLGGATVAASYLGSPEREKQIAEHMVRVGLLDELAVGEARLIRHGTTPFWVYRMDTERIVALSAVCTHVRCVLDFDRRQRQVVCPCHDGRFDLSGNVLSGPPPRPLPTYPVSVRSGEIFVQL